MSINEKGQELKEITKYMSRRNVLLAGLGLVFAGVLGRVGHQRLKSGPAGHDAYFAELQQALREAGVAHRSLIIDRERMEANLQRLIRRIRPEYHYRVVAKSLPSIELLDWVMTRADTRRLMLFNEPFLRQVAAALPHSDILLGKPLTAGAAHHFYQHYEADSGFDPDTQLQWLIDSPQRLADYAALADTLRQPMQVSLEIDIGLHRGGISDTETAGKMVTQLRDDPWLTFSGFMGYEAHIPRAPGGAARNFSRAMARYAAFVRTAEEALGHGIEDLTLNTGGSTTYNLYPGVDVLPNELSVGSALVQPTDFDLPTLDGHQPAAFIAAPLLKVIEGLQLPGAPGLGRLLGLWDRRYEQTFFIDGGYWKALPESPAKLTTNALYGRSSNQEMLNGPADIALAPDDFLFFRPTQSEVVLQDFGDLFIYDSKTGRFPARWAPFPRR